MSDATFTFRVDQALKDEFATTAKARDRTSAQLLRDFMRDFVRQQHEAAEYEDYLQRKVEAGRKSMHSGRGCLNDEVEADFAARRAKVSRRA